MHAVNHNVGYKIQIGLFCVIVLQSVVGSLNRSGKHLEYVRAQWRNQFIKHSKNLVLKYEKA